MWLKCSALSQRPSLLWCSQLSFLKSRASRHLSTLLLLVSMSRPESTGHASLFYNAKEARKYDSSSRMVGVQREITDRAIELLRLDSSKPALVLDVGCGSGLSGQVLEERGHAWVGCDVSRDMLHVANERIERKRQAVDEDEEMEEEDSSDDEGGTPTASTGDLLHHVRLLRAYTCCL